MMDKYIPPEIVQSILSVVSTIGASTMGRLAYHAQLSQKSERKFFSKHLLFELIIAVSIAYFAEGVTTYLGLEGKVAFGAIVAISYMGPRGIEVIVAKLLKVK